MSWSTQANSLDRSQNTRILLCDPSNAQDISSTKLEIEAIVLQSVFIPCSHGFIKCYCTLIFFPYEILKLRSMWMCFEVPHSKIIKTINI